MGAPPCRRGSGSIRDSRRRDDGGTAAAFSASIRACHDLAGVRILPFTPPGTSPPCPLLLDIYARPANRFVADFIGRVNFLEGQVTEAGPDRVRITVHGRSLDVPSRRGNVRAGEPAFLVVRPETIRLAQASSETPQIFAGTIRRAVYLGPTVEYEIDWDGSTLLAVSGSPLEHGLLPEGARVAFDFPAATAHVLPFGEGRGA